MIVSWDKTGEHIWFGVWSNTRIATRLYLVAERLPASKGWDWAVWQSDEPMILRRGIAPSALEAAASAEVAASRWWEVGQTVLSK